MSDLGEMRGRSSRGACERGASEARDAPPAAKGFLAAFSLSVPRAQASPAGLGRAKVGSCFPHLLLPCVPLPGAGSASAEEVNRVGGAAPLPRQGFLPASPAVRTRGKLVRSQQGQPVRVRLLPGSHCAPKVRLETKRYGSGTRGAVPGGAGQAGRAVPAEREPGAAGAPCVPAAGPGPGTRCSRESWQRSAPLQLLRGRRDFGAEVSRCL